MTTESPSDPSPDPIANTRRARLHRRWNSLTQANKIAVAVPLAVAVIGGIVALIAALLPSVVAQATRGGPLDLVDALVADLGDEGIAVVDIKVLSHGQEVAFIKRADLIIEDARQIKFCPHPSAQPVTYTYDVELPAKPDRLPTTISAPLSQALKPNEPDRFDLRLGTKGPGIGGSVYLFTLRLYYNAGEENYVESRPLLAYVSYPSEVMGATTVDSPQFRACIRENAQNLQDLTSKDAVRSQKLNDLTDRYRKAAHIN